MTTHTRRLATLEAGAGLSPTWSERVIAFFGWLSSPSLIVVAGRFAKDLAHRRYGDGWFTLAADQRAARVRIERANLAARLASEPSLHAALRGWLAEGDTLPPLPHGTGTGYADYVVQLVRERAMLAVHRSWDGPYGAAWRSRHPAWRPDFTPDELDLWEASTGMAWIRS